MAALLKVISICKLYWEPSTPLISVIPFLPEDDFWPVGLLTNFLSEAGKMVAVETFLEVKHIRVEFDMWVSL